MATPKTFLVGGAVRDHVIEVINRHHHFSNEHFQQQLTSLQSHQAEHDLDYVVVGADAEDMLKQGYTQVGRDFPVFLHPQTRCEYALARKEKKVASGHQGFHFDTSCDISLEDDLFRRDFTVNAMAWDELGKNIIDPFQGLQDCQNRILRHVSEHFVEDPLRVLRGARFVGQLGFELSADTKKLMCEMVNQGMLEELSAERIAGEFFKAYQNCDKPSVFFKTLDEIGALDRLIPQLKCLQNVPQPPKYHPEGDAYVHTLLVIDSCKELGGDEKCFIACLCHDFGKALTDSRKWPSHHNHEHLGLAPAQEFCSRYKLSNEVTDFTLRFTRDHLLIHKSHTLTAAQLDELLTDLYIRRTPQWLPGFLLCANADQLGKLDRSTYHQSKFLMEVFREISENFRPRLSQATKSSQDGRRIAEEVQSQRISCIKQFLNS